MNSRSISGRYLTFASFVLCPLIAFGQQFQGPVAGFNFDSVSGSLRPVTGVAGAAYLGDPILTGLSFGSVAPNGKQGIAVKDGQAWFLSALSPLTLQPMPDALSQPEKVVWSGDSSTAVLYSPSSGQLQKIGPMGAAGPLVDLTSLGSVVTLAVDGAGENIAVGIGGDGSGIYWIASGAAPALISGDTGKNSALAFSRNGDHLYAADRDARRILDIQSGTIAGVFLEGDAAPVDPVALALSADDKFLYIASGANSAIQAYEITTRQPGAAIQLDFAPSCIDPLGGSSLFRLNISDSQTPLLVFDPRGGGSVFFVPVAAAVAGGTE